MLKLLSSFLTLWLLFFLYVYYRRKFEQMKLTNALLPQDTLGSSGLIASARAWSLLPEAVLCGVHAPPFLSWEVSFHYYDLHRGTTLLTVLSTDELAALFMVFARLLLLVRWAPYLAGLTSRHTRLYANMNHLSLNTWLSLRISYRRTPLRVMCVSTSILLPIFGFALQVVERRVNHDLADFGNCLWLAFSSMTAIGYGELYAQTPLGRIVCAAALTWGATVAALLVLTVIHTTQLSKQEQRVDHMVEVTRSRQMLKERAAYYVQAAWAAYLERLQRSQSSLGTASLLGHEALHADAKFCRAMRSFREMRKRLMVPDDDHIVIFKEVLDSRSRIEHRLRDVEEKLEEMDAKFEHNIAAMNELLQKNLKYLKHLAP